MMKQNHSNQILSAAVEVFHERGFHNSGTQDIVTRAGVSKGSFYNHFKTKDALGLAVLDYYWESHQASLKLLRAPDQAPLERIENYFNSIAYDDKGCIIGNFSSELSGSDEFRARLVEVFRGWVSEIATCIADGQKDGTIRDNDDATVLAEFVTVSYEGAILKAKVDRDPAVLERFRHSILSFLKHR
jgi:TetR/AcrR family transcriptional repressor of nem operon